jgi:hypothetical protein
MGGVVSFLIEKDDRVLLHDPALHGSIDSQKMVGLFSVGFPDVGGRSRRGQLMIGERILVSADANNVPLDKEQVLEFIPALSSKYHFELGGYLGMRSDGSFVFSNARNPRQVNWAGISLIGVQAILICSLVWTIGWQLAVISDKRRLARIHAGHCPVCGYDVHATQIKRCPECGTTW